MITQRDLQEAIAECEGKRNPDSSTCIKLAAFYTIRDTLFPVETPQAVPRFTQAAPPGVVEADGDSDFLRLVDGRPQKEVWPVLDELMETIGAINPRLYDAVMRKLQ